MISGLRLAAFGLCIMFVASSCGSGFDRDGAVEAFQNSFPEAEQAQAECVVDRLVERYELDGLEDELESETITDEFAVAQFRAMFNCGMTDDVEQRLVADLTDRDYGDEDAGCIAAALVDDLTEADLDVLLSGEITDSFYEKYFVALEACDALP